ncbi:MAG TPA: type II secretion system protein [Candidatus Limnocylindria bacterium]|nr:type II secretion system protein [Candidatus Limnocylindria bacterium]
MTQGAGVNRSAHQRGFALPDLLAVLAVLVTLGAIAGIPLVRVRQRSQKVTCAGNLGVVGRALLLYAQDSRSQLPGPVPGQRDVWWGYKDLIQSYVKKGLEASSAETVFVCPRDRGYSDPVPFSQSARFGMSSYVFNGVSIPGVPSISGWNLGAIAEPKRTLLVMEWAAHAPLSWHRSRTGKANAPFYKDAECVVGFVDGRAAETRIYYDGFNAAYTRDPIAGYDYRFSGN